MKKITSLIIIAALFAVSAVQAQTVVTTTATTDTNGITTIVQSTNTPTPPSSFWGGIGTTLGSLGLSSNPTNYAGLVFVGMSTSGKQVSAGIGIVENVNNNVGIIVLIDHLWFGGKTGSANIVSGGLTLKQPTHPLAFFGGSFCTNLVCTPYVILAVGTPMNGTGNADGGLAGIGRAGFNFDIWNISGWELGLGIDYGNRTGSGGYNGDWIDGTLNLRKGF